MPLLNKKILAGPRLASLLNNAIDEAATEERTRSDIIDEMADEAGITASTVNQILNASIDCPPRERLAGFARVNGLPSLAAQIRAANEDGCEIEDNQNSGGKPMPTNMTPREIADELHHTIKQFQNNHDRFREEVKKDISQLQSTVDQHALQLRDVELGPIPRSRDSKQHYEARARDFFSNVLKREPKDSEVDLTALREYENAFASWIRRGDALPYDIKASMSVGSDPDGGFWVPPNFVDRVLQRLFATSPMRQLATVERLNTDSITFPVDSEELTAGGWVSELESRDVTANPQVGTQTLYAREQFAQPELAQKLLDDAAINIENWLANKIARRLAWLENKAFVSGEGVKDPRGFLSRPVSTSDDDSRDWGTLQIVKTGVDGAFPTEDAEAIDKLIELQVKLQSPYLENAVWTMRRSTAATTRQLKDGQGRHYWLDNVTEGGRPLFLGHRVVFFEDMPAIASNSLSIAFGDFSHYAIFDHRVGLRMLRDNVTKKGFVRFYTYKRVAGDVLGEGFDAIKLLQFAS